MRNKKLEWFLLLMAGVCIFFSSCERETNLDPESIELKKPVTGNTLKVNTFIHDYSKELYFWTSTVNWTKMDPKYEPNSFDFFEKLIYKDDRWSMLTDDAQGFYNVVDGISTSFGYELIWARFSNSTLFAVVLYVYPGTPAEQAGLKRGDFLVSINGAEDITENNYMDFYNAPSILAGKATLTDSGLEMDGLISLTAVSMYEDPVVKDTIVVKGAHKIGYLCYTSYTEESTRRLLEVFSRFKAQGVSDVVLDLRYNGGGYAEVARLLSSILAPAPVVKRKDIFLTQTWNKQCMASFAKDGDDTNEYFMDALPVNMNLSRLYVLTMEYSASASEATIIGLKPYMNVIQIGDTTHGKYYGGGLISPMVFDRGKNDWVVDTQIENWMMYLMLYRYADKNGDTSFSGGLVPDIYAEEDYFPLYPLGDERDPLFGKAVEMITGAPVQTRAAKGILHPYAMEAAKLRSPLNGKMIHTGALPSVRLP